MATSGVNLAVTKDGETYNKLQRPADYLASTHSTLLPLATLSSSAVPSSKRKREQNDESGNKRLRNDRNAQNFKGRSRATQIYQEHGIQTVLPGLDGEEQLSDESTSEALAYLHSVRSEASTIPTLLVAPNKPNDVDNNANEKHVDHKDTAHTGAAVYNDGTYIAVDNRSEVELEYWDGDSHDLDPQESCHAVLLQRFRAHRNKFASTQKAIAVLGRTAGTGDSRHTQKLSKHEWSDIITHGYPVVKDILQLDESSLYLALQGCALVLDQTDIISRQKSCWIWTLLAMLGEFGTLDHKRIGKIRDLGLKAGRLAVRLRSERLSSQHSLQGDVNERPALVDMKSGGQEAHCHDEMIMDEATEVCRQSITDTKDTEQPKSDSAQAGGTPCDVGRVLHAEDGLDSDAGDFDVEMVISEDGEQVLEIAEDGSLEAARARLLEQLGDRLVHSEMSSPDMPSEVTPTHGPKLLSRVEAEIQRQQMRRQEPCEKAGPPSLSSTPSPTWASRRELDSAPLTEDELNTKATIDMILTVVAECYGQRDLLRFREVW